MAENEEPLDLSTFRTPERRPPIGYKANQSHNVWSHNHHDRRQGPSERRQGPPQSRPGPPERRQGAFERRQGPTERRQGALQNRQARIPLKVNFFFEIEYGNFPN